MKNQRKPKAIELLQNGTKPETVAEQTGYSIRRVYQIRKEINSKEQKTPEPTPENTDIAIAMQSMPIDDISARIDAETLKILDSINKLHQEALTAISIHEFEEIRAKIKILNSLIDNLNQLRPLPPPQDLTELFNNGNATETTNEEGTDLRRDLDERQDPTTTSANDTDFADILERTADTPTQTD